MEQEKLIELIEKPEELQKAIVAEKTNGFKITDLVKQIDPKQHAIADKAARPDKVVVTDATTRTVEVARLPIPMQKRIVRLAATFLCGRPIELVSNQVAEAEKNLLEVMQKTWKDNKLDYKSKKLAKLMMAETECAEIWYTEEAEEGFWKGTVNEGKSYVKFKLRMKILSPGLGDQLYPVFNAAGDMIAFGRGYTVAIEGKKVERLDLYTAEKFYYFTKSDTGWQEAKKPEENIVKKIPVIYYSQEAPEWYDVQDLIERFEKSISNHADTNDYHASPTIVSQNAKIVGFAQKGEQGKLIEVEGQNADVKYLSWDKSPDSTKLEQENLLNLIYSLTDTPNISFEQMKGLGTFSGIALKMLFLGAHMKASDHEENFGESVQRRLNYLKAAMVKVNEKDLSGSETMYVEPKFTYFLPKNEQEMIEMLTTAAGPDKPIMSRKTAVTLNPLVEDPENELELIKDEANSSEELDNQFK